MDCPACGRPLSPVQAGELTVDTCVGGCGGLWFDHYELRRVDERSESAGAALLDVPRDPSVVVDRTRRYACPKSTTGAVMLRHFWSVERAVTIDECPECGGIFLDAGELRSIREEFATDSDRQAAADAYFHEVADPLLDRARAVDAEELERAQRFAHALRFVTPSWYIPGKQAGAAF